MKIVKFALAASVLALAACSTAGHGGAAMQSYDEQAPYALDRTAGSGMTAHVTHHETAMHKADRVYNKHQNK